MLKETITSFIRQFITCDWNSHNFLYLTKDRIALTIIHIEGICDFDHIWYRQLIREGKSFIKNEINFLDINDPEFFNKLREIIEKFRN